MIGEKQIEIKVVTYKEERLNYFTELYEKAKNKFDRLFKKHKDAPYLSDEFQKMSDARREAEFLGDVVKMLKQSAGAWEKRVFVIFDSEKVGYKCSECNTTWDTATPYCPNCGAKMKGADNGI